MAALRILFLLLPFSLFGQNLFEDRFPDENAGPLPSSRRARPGGTGITYVQTDGNLSISAGMLVVPAQATPIDGDLSYHGDRFDAKLGRTLFFKVVPTTLAFLTGVQPGGMIGFSDNVDPINGFDIWSTAGFGISGTGAKVRVWPFFCPSVSTDEEDFAGTDTMVVNSTYSVAIVMGGLSSNQNEYAGSPGTIWYQGQTESSFPHGQTFFIKKDDGNWIRQGLFVACSGDAGIGRPAVTNYNSAFKVDDVVVSNKIDLSLLQPLHYTSMIASNGTQLFDIPPEVGTAYDSIAGNFTITSNAVAAAGTGDPTINWVTAENMGVPDAFGEAKVNVFGTGNWSFVFRYKASNRAHIIVNFNSTQLRAFTFNGTSYSQIGSTVTYAHAFPSTPLLRAACIGNKFYGWLYDQANPDDENALVATSSLNNTETAHGLGTSNSTASLKYVRFFKSGGDGGYNQILNDYMLATNLTRRGGQ